MPYIKAESRPTIDELTNGLIDHVKSLPVEEQDGALNYAVTRVLKSVYPTRYFHFNRAMGVLACIQAELYRVVIGPYEDIKIDENGAVEPRQ